MQDSALTAEAMGETPGVSNGGNIMVNAAVVVLNHSEVRANAFGGSGGNIEIDATAAFLASPDSILDASSRLGLPGKVEVISPVTNLSEVVTPLTPTFDQDSPLSRDRCAARRWRGTVSSLIARGRDGMPAAPGGVLPGVFDAARDEALYAQATGENDLPAPGFSQPMPGWACSSLK